MFEVLVENKRGHKIDFVQNNKYAITNISGLGPPDAEINLSEVGPLDGAEFNSSKLKVRNIVMTIEILGNVEANRIALYKVFKSKEWIKFYYKNGLRDVYIEGYIENAPVELFTQNEAIQISILCPDPYFKNAQEIIEDIGIIINNFSFPFAIEEEGIPFSKYDEILEKTVVNNGDVEKGVIIEIRASGNVLNPKIFNRETAEFFGLNIELIEGDVVTITTIKGLKTVFLLRNAETINIFNNIMKDITWLQLAPGDNVFTFEAEKGIEFLNIMFRHIDNFEGV